MAREACAGRGRGLQAAGAGARAAAHLPPRSRSRLDAAPRTCSTRCSCSWRPRGRSPTPTSGSGFTARSCSCRTTASCTSRFAPTAERTASELRPAVRVEGRLSPVRIGFVGTLVWHKGLHVLLEAARELPAGAYEIEVWGALDTFPDYTASLRAMARGLPVRFCGAFHNGQGADVYSRFDLLVVPSLWPENSPLVIHEAFMAGVPVVAARIGGIPELVTDGVNGVLYDPASPAALADALRGLILEAGPPRGDGRQRASREVDRRRRARLGTALRVARS
ncbi:MAG: glycosyltransferase [Chromatiales bacterium]|nr:glycosyltransferase [Chromatiales bacterium]